MTAISFALTIPIGVNVALAQAVNDTPVDEAHMQRAIETVFMTRVTRAYTEIIPNITERIRARMLEQKPELAAAINRIVDQTALELAERQGELDTLIARAWAERFNPQELREITAFYATPTGSKLARANTDLIAIGLENARSWSRALADEMVAIVQEKLRAEGHDF